MCRDTNHSREMAYVHMFKKRCIQQIKGHCRHVMDALCHPVTDPLQGPVNSIMHALTAAWQNVQFGNLHI